MSKYDDRFSIKISRELEKPLRVIAAAKNKFYGGKGSVTGLIEAVALEELRFFPLVKDAILPEVSGIFFGCGEGGEILHIGKSGNLKHHWVGENQILNQLLSQGVVGIVWIEVIPDLLDEIAEMLIALLHPPLNSPQENPQVILRIPQQISEELVKTQNKTPTEILHAIAHHELMLLAPLNTNQQQALVRAASALIEKSNYSDAAFLLNISQQWTRSR